MGVRKVKLWSDDKIKEELKSVIDRGKMDRMPSAKEIIRISGDNRLTNAIAKHGGFRHWASKIGLPMKETDTLFGWMFEDVAKELLEKEDFSVEKTPCKFPYDLLIDGSVKINVKASRKYIGNAGNFYAFNLERKFPACDIYFLCCVNSGNVVDRFYIIPSSIVPHNCQISIGEFSSKYDKYIGRIDVIKKYSKFFKEEVL
jgi:hypothetical protein